MHEELLASAYAAFNARDIDRTLSTMQQWGVIDPHVEPRRFTTDATGRIVVDVHQVVRDRSGTVVADRMVQHVYRIEQGLIRHTEIRT